ncbi:hypothetical protein A2715_03920 [Candidatus Woesebacteria bacterium RIFCSPHIGHO2_01_FULL_39_32]|uniref:Uncharacterized protein n=1 Tax=Candidatus Woesebacteria bacterium RIFCSPLOWO2_01_FULL_39_25 TaxID=1802521 RepID=A0A1F8BIT2_9BACT|nr:MAG: hypothetical protein A2715_03920 [Candidatus Woesebacteria bacterium RIFCSPHIGHO2_01_FULL_39_32]OGM35530.1 MAG: hypothetical protein A3F01_05040 [Candidatus Woesebacteria bacterium RIFCSPHIGHO2_12_FULL_38_11]OGM63976.1 MAG: hypothetical protein A2893_00510 [Candidatus Woesebacteria bacterium RIFCSPLOWO2_01_FULL_39_25]
MLFLIVLTIITSIFPQTVHAQVPSAGIDFSNLMGTAIFRLRNFTIGRIIQELLPYVFGLAGFLILLFIILGGFQILTSQNDPKALAAGQQKIYNAIVGFIIVFVSFWLVQLVARILDLPPIIDIFG